MINFRINFLRNSFKHIKNNNQMIIFKDTEVLNKSQTSIPYFWWKFLQILWWKSIILCTYAGQAYGNEEISIKSEMNRFASTIKNILCLYT